MPKTIEEIKALTATDFNTLVTKLPHQLMMSQSYLNGGGPNSLPIDNKETFIEGDTTLGQTLAGIIQEILRFERGKAAENRWIYDFDAEDLTEDNILPFFLLTSFGYAPQSDAEYIIWKGGLPLASGFDTSLVPGVGIKFAEAWAAGQNGKLWVFTPALAGAIQFRTYLGASLTGAHHTVLNLSAVGADIFGRTVNPLPDAAAQVQVWVGTLRTLDTSFTFTIDAGAPIITFIGALDPIYADQVIHVMIQKA